MTQIKTPAEIAAQIMGDSETTTMWSDQEGGWVTIASQIVAAIKADRAQRAELEAGARELLAQYDRDELNGPHETAEWLAEALRDLVGER